MNEVLDTLLGKISDDSIEKSIVLKKAKELLPHIMYDKIPFEFDTNGKVNNLDTASSLSAWQKEVIYDLKPRETPMLISYLTNGSGKTYLIGLCLTLLLIDDHPSLSPGFEDVPGEFWLLTNASLLKTEYPDNFLKYPGWLGKEADYKKDGYFEVVNSKGKVNRIKLIRNSSGDLEGFKNESNGKAIRLWSYSVNEQKLAGHNPLSIFCDEFGDKTTTSGAAGANRLTVEKFEEMSVRCGRNHLAGDNWVFCMFFTLTLGEAWIEVLLDKIKAKESYMPRLAEARNLPEDHQFIKLLRSRSTIESNPSINRSTIAYALDMSYILDRGAHMERRLITTEGDDPSLVFPQSCRPNKLDVSEVQDIIRQAEIEPGWMFVEGIDPGWNDRCSILFTLCHPIKGIYILNEFYESKRTVPQVARTVKHIEYEFFRNQVVHKRIYDPNHIKKTTQETQTANYSLWRNEGLPGVACHWSRGDRAYDRMFELMLKGMLHYSPTHCKGLNKELRNHKKDKYGLPEEKANNHSIDAMRYISNWFYEDFGKKIHLASPAETKELTEEHRMYLAQLAYYNNFVKHEIEAVQKSKNKLLNCTIRPMNTKGLKGLN